VLIRGTRATSSDEKVYVRNIYALEAWDGPVDEIAARCV